MSVDATSYYDTLTSSSSSSSSSVVYSDDSSSSLTADDFLALLTTQLQNQDPTNPMDNAEMVSQMNQYTMVEQLSEISGQLETLTETAAASSGMDYLGKEVVVEGSSVVKSGDSVTSLAFEVGDDASAVVANIYDSSGNIVDTVTMTDIASGTVSLSWDGTDSDGNEVDDGTYYASVASIDDDGKYTSLTTSVSRTVTGVSSTSDGVVLTLDDGSEVNALNVSYVGYQS